VSGRRRPRIPGTYARALYVLPSIPDALDATIKNGLAIRNACAVDGRCPDCGVVGVISVDADGLYHLTFQHDDVCRVLRDDGSTSA
jgi:hypothetical protein